MRPTKKIAFVLAAANHGNMIVNRFDYATNGQGVYGVGCQILETSSYDASEVDALLKLLAVRREIYGDGVMAIDCGANIGVHTIEWAWAMHGWGEVIAMEPQEPVFYALAGNIAINNCFNAHAIHAAVGAHEGMISVPRLDYLKSSSFGSLELIASTNNENIGQFIDYTNGVVVRQLAIDSLKLRRLDLLKIDVEGMELDVLAGACQTIMQCRPILFIEYVKTNPEQLGAVLRNFGYQRQLIVGMNILALHDYDASNEKVR